MTVIILERFPDGGVLSVDTDNLTQPNRENGIPYITLIQQDINNGTNISGYRDYAQHLEYFGVFPKSEINKWRAKLNAVEKPIPKQAEK